jgi:hypothetical protein
MRIEGVFCAAFLLPLLLLIPQPVGAQQDLSSFPENIRFDPFLSEEISSCTIPPYQDESLNYLPVPEGYCPEQSPIESMTEEVLNELAVAYAPVLFYHPLERHTMAAVDYTFQDPTAGRIMYENDQFSEVFAETLNQTSLLQSTRDRNLGINSHRYYFEHILDPEYVAGAGFDETGRSKAPIYYNAHRWEKGTWIFTYHFYYTVNGYGNFGVVSSYNDSVNYTRFAAGPYDGHEGDWESISVMVCQSTIPTRPIAVSYTQQTFNQITDCTAGDCTFYKDSIHPVGFVALNSHATYPMASKEIVFQNLKSDFFVDLQGTVAVDRTVYYDDEGNIRYFEPDEANVIRIKDQEEIGLGISDPLEYWQGFGGTWGSTNLLPQLLYDLTLKCFNSNQTEVIDCPTEEENPVFYLVLQVLGIRGGGSLLTQAASLLVDSVERTYPNTGKSPRGPSAELSYVKWQNPKNAPLWSSIAKNTTAEEYCTSLTNVTDETRLSPVVEEVPLDDNVYSLIYYCVAVMMVTIIFYTVDECRRKPSPPLCFNVNGELLEPSWRSILLPGRSAVLYSVFYVITIAGIVLFLSGYTALRNLLEPYLGLNLDTIYRQVLVMVVIIIVIDSICLIVIWIPTHDILLCRVLMAYYDTIGNDLLAEYWKNRRWATRGDWGVTAFKVMFAALFGSLVLAAVIVVFGCFNVGLAYGLGQVCDGVVGAVDNLCFEVNVFGIDGIPCGFEFQNFCAEFASKQTIITLWGAFVTVSGHYYLIASAGASHEQCKAVLGALYLLPNRSQYLESIADLSQIINKEELDRLQEEEDIRKEGPEVS